MTGPGLTAYSFQRLEEARLLRQAEEGIRRARQLETLRMHLRQAGKTAYYGDIFRDLGFSPEEPELFDSFSRLPLTERADLDRNPTAFHATPPQFQVDIALTSGTTGVPVAIPYTARDLQRLAFNEAVNFRHAGTSTEDRYLLCVTLDRCFVAGLAYYSGLVMLGASVIRGGPGQPESHWELLRQLKPNALVGVPSFLQSLAEWGESRGYLRDTRITKIMTIGEPVRQADHSFTPLGRGLQQFWQADIFSSYGATEMQTAFCDCPAHVGAHVHPELMLTEIVGDDGSLMPPGQPGEIVVTPLGVEGMPLVRFRTGDVARIHSDDCACGWKTPRLGAIEGRLSQRLKFRGTTLYPEMIFHALQESSLADAAYIEASQCHDLSDDIVVVLGTDDSSITVAQIETILQARLRVKPKVVLAPKELVLGRMANGGRKRKTFFDNRRKTQ